MREIPQVLDFLLGLVGRWSATTVSEVCMGMRVVAVHV